MWLPLSRALGCTKLYTYSHIISMTSSSDRSSWENIIHIRPAVPEDVPGIMWMVQLLAECSKDPDAPQLTKEDFLRDGFGDQRLFHVLVAELNDASPSQSAPSINATSDLPSDRMERNERLVGYAMYTFGFSPWKGRELNLEDLFVREEYRSRGLGTALMGECAKVAKSMKCNRMKWIVLDWNTKAVEFYNKIGGEIVKKWLYVKLDCSKFSDLYKEHVTA